jgi:uracil-DNA glycosylase family 4
MRDRSQVPAPGAPAGGRPPVSGDALSRLGSEIAACRACPRLNEWRAAAATDPPRRFRGQVYWARPVPGFGDPDARIVLVGLAPAAHGANRTGRMFTGDRSGDWLYAALHRAGLASQPTAVSADDGLELADAFVTAAVRCAPPQNKPTTEERDRCLPFLVRELALLERARVLVCLGGFGWAATLRALAESGHELPRPRPRFGHGAEARVGPYSLLGCFHPSQQNTFTGRLTEPMLDAILARARELAAG